MLLSTLRQARALCKHLEHAITAEYWMCSTSKLVQAKSRQLADVIGRDSGIILDSPRTPRRHKVVCNRRSSRTGLVCSLSDVQVGLPKSHRRLVTIAATTTIPMIDLSCGRLRLSCTDTRCRWIATALLLSGSVCQLQAHANVAAFD